MMQKCITTQRLCALYLAVFCGYILAMLDFKITVIQMVMMIFGYQSDVFS